MIGELEILRYVDMALFSKLAYEDDFDFKTLGYKQSWEFNREDVQLYVINTGKELVVAVRGTEPTNFNDWKRNFKYKPDKNHQVGIHAGYLYAARLAMNFVVDKMMLEVNRNLPVSLTGHSQGAGIALILSDFLNNIKDVTLFGCPMVMGEDAVDAYRHKDKVNRIVNHNDIASRFPFGLGKTAHVGEMIYINKNAQIIISPSIWYRLCQYILSRPFDVFRDHTIDVYLTKLRSIAS